MDIPGDFCFRDKKAEKILKYRDPALEMSRMWSTKTRVTSIVIGALGAEDFFTEYLALIGVMTRKSDSMHHTAMPGFANNFSSSA